METYNITKPGKKEELLRELQEVFGNGEYPVPYEQVEMQNKYSQEVYDSKFKGPIKEVIKYIFNRK